MYAMLFSSLVCNMSMCSVQVFFCTSITNVRNDTPSEFTGKHFYLQNVVFDNANFFLSLKMAMS